MATAMIEVDEKVAAALQAQAAHRARVAHELIEISKIPPQRAKFGGSGACTPCGVDRARRG
jgi:hypothetical protein